MGFLRRAHKQGNGVATSSGPKPGGFLPYAAAEEKRAEVLEAIVAGGGEAVARYKRMTYDALAMREGLRVLDIGCGIGVDLAALAALVGPTGMVVGLDHDEALLQKARTRLQLEPITTDGGAPSYGSKAGAGGSPGPIMVVEADAHQVPYPDGSFDRVRTDRVLQYVQDPARAIAEMHRVLRPGGLMVLTEPDWKTIAIHPASTQGGDDDRTLAAVLGRYQRTIAHPLIGRQLWQLVRSGAAPGWEDVSIEAHAFALTSWQTVDVVLQMAEVAKALAAEERQLAGEIEAWLAAVAQADAAETFWAMLPLIFAVARKPM